VEVTTGITRVPAVLATITTPCCLPVGDTVAAGPPTVVRAPESATSTLGLTVTVAAASVVGSIRTEYVQRTAGPKVSTVSELPLHRVSDGGMCFPLGENRWASAADELVLSS
jgi:hypothetical protein